MVQRSTSLDYRLPSTVESIQQGWLISCQSSALISGLLALISTVLLVFFKAPDNLSTPPKSSNGLVALDVVGFCSVFLNVSACISCFILLDRLGEIPYHAARDSNVPLGGKIAVPQHRILRIYGIGALWRWVVWYWLICFIIGASCVFAQLLLYVWLQESKAIRIALTVLVGFSALPMVTFILAPFANILKNEDQAPELKSMSSKSDIEANQLTPTSPLSSIHAFPSVRPPGPGRPSSHRSSGAPPFHGKMSPLGLKEPHTEAEFRVSFSGNPG
ncbi:hypothetical protein M413DRAFT_442929 [Hebeloma cylindrosporum]|uniref:Uncharacterized protein n=1 Tax=Hebeloma cylindrosporum TaxID=76867 RepID=A0A0C2Y502_HEBCY|nr:hypothetical protein M413DRAFT_442929 [Hebeloma cylindrosporum h7]